VIREVNQLCGIPLVQLIKDDVTKDPGRTGKLRDFSHVATWGHTKFRYGCGEAKQLEDTPEKNWAESGGEQAQAG